MWERFDFGWQPLITYRDQPHRRTSMTGWRWFVVATYAGHASGEAVWCKNCAACCAL